MAGTQTDLRIKADDRLREARKSGASPEDIRTLEAAREAAREVELKATGGNRQAGE